jgi:hypothetical protein
MPSRGDSLGEKMASASGFCEGGFFSLPDFGGPGAIRAATDVVRLRPIRWDTILHQAAEGSKSLGDEGDA